MSLGGVVANPLLSKIEEGVALAKAEKVDFVLAVGGGSVIDSSKSIAVGALSDKPVWSFVGQWDIDKALPVGAILTIAAAGSEMSSGAVLTNDETNLKKDFGGRAVRPVFAILNPELTYTLPRFQTICKASDVILHTVERYFTNADTMDITDLISNVLIQNVQKHTRVILEDPENYESRAEIMWSGSLSHNGLTGARSSGGDWAVHMMGHEISAKYDLAHAASLTTIWATWARFAYKGNEKRFEKFAVEVMEVEKGNLSTNEVIEAGINKLESFFKEIGMPTSLLDVDFEVSEEDIKDMALKATNNDGFKLGDIKPLDANDVITILTAAKK